MLGVMAGRRLLRQRVEGEQLDPGAFWLLKNIATQPRRVTELAGCANLDASTVSRHITQLDRTGIVERIPDPDDRRAHQVQLTALGRQLLQDGFARRRELLGRALADWDPDDVAQLDRLLERLVADLDTLQTELEQA